MSIRRRSEALAAIKPGVTVSDGKPYKVFMVWLGRKRDGRTIRIVRATKEGCRKGVEDFYNKLERSGEGILDLEPAQVYDAQCAYKLMREAGVGATLVEAARMYVGSLSAEHSGAPLRDVYSAYYAQIPDIQHYHKLAVRKRVLPFVQFVGEKNVGAVTADDVRSFLDMKPRSPKTWNNLAGYIKTFLNWCAKKSNGYIVSNPVVDMEMKPIVYKEPAYMKVDDVRRLFEEAKKSGTPETVAYMALSFFAGMRHEEIVRLSKNPDDCRPAQGTCIVRMPKGWSSGMAPRSFHLEDNCKAWLETLDLAKVLPGVSNYDATKGLKKAAAAAGVKVPKNAGRHSFITYHVAKYADPQRTESICGTSAKMRTAHYMGLTDKAQGDAYFSIMP